MRPRPSLPGIAPRHLLGLALGALMALFPWPLLAAEVAQEEMAPEALYRSRPPASLAASATAGEVQPEPGLAPEKAAEFSVPIPWGEPSFESFRSAYLSEGGRAWLKAIMARAEPFLPYIAERIRWYGLPDELLYLPVIESEYSSKAVSRSGAMGLWQFMKNSIGGYGIRIDDWVDERRDFMKSTDAALRKLADNYSRHEDWNLALAAYNMGDGAVSRAVKKARSVEGAPEKIDYWYLRSKGYLAAETTSYVPKFLAVASILSYPARNGLALSWKEGLAWESLELRRSIDLGLLAEAAGIPVATLRAANPELKYNVTPPWPGYRIKVPAESVEAVRAVLDNPELKLIRYYLHHVRSRDTLSAIGRYYGTPQKMIVDANPGLVPDRLRLGQTLVVPALKDVAAPEARPSEDLKLDFSGAYTVAKGDSLWSISLRYEVQPEVLAEKNGLSLTSVIREGMVLRVPILK